MTAANQSTSTNGSESSNPKCGGEVRAGAVAARAVAIAESAALFVLIVLGLLGLLPGQANAQSYGQADVPTSQARSVLPVQAGVVIDLQSVAIEIPAQTDTKALGAAIGGAAGALSGQGGGWQGQLLGGSIGVLVGTKLATRVGNEMRESQQVIVQLDSGQTLAIVQEENGPVLSIGDRIFMIGSYPAIRIMKAPQTIRKSAAH